MSFSDKVVKRINGVVFGYYKTEEIRNLSVKEINNSVAFDHLNRPKQGGLYDPVMGVSPYDKFAKCVTCGQEGLTCPGHMGHIELLLPVYNPFLMEKIHKLLRSKCFTCHRLRIPEEKLKSFHNILLLLKLGYLIQGLDYQSLSSAKLFAKETKSSKPKATESDFETNYESEKSRSQSRKASVHEEKKNSKRKETSASESDQTIQMIKIIGQFIEDNKERKEELEKYLKPFLRPEDFEKGIVFTSGLNKIIRETIASIWASVNSLKCPHCGSKPMLIKKEGTSKFFICKKNDKERDAQKEELGNPDEEVIDIEEEEKSKFLDKEKEREKGKNYIFLNPLEVRDHIKSLWRNDKSVLSLIFGSILINSQTLLTSPGFKVISSGPQMFFIEIVPVPPNRFRPENKLADQTFLHGQTVTLTKLLTLNIEFKNMMVGGKGGVEIKENLKKTHEIKKISKLTDFMKKWLEIQDCVNCFFDATKAIKPADKEGVGIKQLLEKKEGLFRMKMMGKRVNFAARSVISPDPYLDTNEVGVPLFMAKKLTFPEYVNETNLKKLRQMIINGPFKHPGANILEENGNRISLETRTDQQRIALAKTLMHNADKKVVYRHLTTGDVLMFNRQPTLHRPSIMSHIARVLPKEQTIRMHYANCNSYNADFDGDEMNLHFVQNHVARAEGYSISLTDKQYIVPKDGRPIRGLIQDSIVSAALLTSKDTFLNKHEYQELLYIATWNLVNGGVTKEKRIDQVKPAILKPEPLWTGKQLISNILKVIVTYDRASDSTPPIGLNMESKTKLPADVFGLFSKEETQVLLSDNELLQGVLDKNQIGNSEYGIVHSFYELYGASLTGKLLTSFSRLFTAFLQKNGFSCSVEDLFLNRPNECERKKLVEDAHREGIKHIAQYAGLEDYKVKKSWKLCNRPEYERGEGGKRKEGVDYIGEDDELVETIRRKVLMEENILAEMDSEMKGALNQSTSQILKLTNSGLLKSYPKNFFSAMVLTGAKGSTVNHNQVSIMLGQQELEGRRVPTMPSGRTLPSFIPYDPNPRSGGYITDRFLTGLRPQDFFFHCMAGREGLIDTAVKTSRSGYLQRCLMKHLEGLIVNYDFTVRDSDGSIVQFLYGEDSIDPTKKQFLEKFGFLASNYKGYNQRYNPKKLAQALNQTAVRDYLKLRKASANENNGEKNLINTETILSRFDPGNYMGAISERGYFMVSDFILAERKKEGGGIFGRLGIEEKKFFTLFNIKYFYSLVTPGDGVGPIAAQSIGEPSTQMTLNTFHLAGHGGANVTLGIPRLREILMTATEKIKTPSMILKLRSKSEEKEVIREEAERWARKLERVIMLELVKSVEIREKNKLGKNGKVLGAGERARIYNIEIEFVDMEAIKFAFGIDQSLIKQRLEKNFIPNILILIHKQFKKSAAKNFEIKSRVIKSQNELAEEEDLIDNGFEEVDLIEENPDALSKVLGEKEDALRKGSDDIENIEKEKENVNETVGLTGRGYLQYLKKFSFDGGKCKIKVKLPLDSKKLLMINLVEYVLSMTLVYEVKGITKTHVLQNENGDKREFSIQTEGVNYEACWNCDFIDPNKIHSNDIQSIHKTYGVEAARTAIIREIFNVFSAYHITVDFRHLSLIADYMTFSGEIKAMNRTGIQDSTSGFLKMSYETTMNFLTQASLSRELESMSTPSAQIVLGRVPKVGTGMFDILYTLK